MRIRSVETTVHRIPFRDGGRGEGIGPTTWNALEIALVRIEDEDGRVGWGEGFGYFTAAATKAIVDRMIAPLLEGTVVEDIPAWNLEMQRRLHLFGRYGITMFAISGVDIALWDLAARRRGVPLHALLGARAAPEVLREVPFYASLVRYGDAALAARTCERALGRGFTDIKLHEIGLEEISACREAVGARTPLSVDVNANWSEAQTRDRLEALAELNVAWLEEPIFPPEAMRALARLRGGRVPLAAGENWCTDVQFALALEHGAIDAAQPSVTKVGGISEFLRVAQRCRAAGIPLLPHSPYYGPGFQASLHLAAALPEVRQLEYLFVEPDAWIVDPGAPGPDGRFPVPEGPGLGFEPDLAVLERSRVA